MKKITGLLLAILIVAGATSCKKIINALFPGIETDIPAITVVIPKLEPFPGAPVPADEMPVGSFTQHFNLDSIVRSQTNGSFGADDVGSVNIKKISFNLANADQQNNLSNFKSVRFTFTSNSTQGVADIGTIFFPDSTMTTYDFIPANTTDLRPYLDGSQLTTKVYGQLRRYTTKSLQMTMHITLKVK